MKIAYLDILYDGTDAFEELVYELRKHSSEDTVIDYHYVTGADNLEYLAFEAFVIPRILVKIDQLRRLGYDAVIIGCCHDPAVDAAKELFDDIIIVGPLEAALLSASVLGKRISVIAVRDKTAPKTYECVERAGLTPKLASIRTLEIKVMDLQKDHDLLSRRMEEVVEKALTEDKADVIVLGCTMETGQYRALQIKFGVPIIDPSIAALMQAKKEYDCRKFCGWTYSRKYGYERPPREETEKFLGITL